MGNRRKRYKEPYSFSEGGKDMKYFELTCENCRKVLMEENLVLGSIKKRCPKCGHWNVYNFDRLDKSKVGVLNWNQKSK